MADTTSNPTPNEPKRKYKLLAGMHRTGGVVYRSGDPDRNILELTKSQAEALGDRVEPVAGGATSTSTTNTKKEDIAADPIPNPNVEKPPAPAPSKTKS